MKKAIWTSLLMIFLLMAGSAWGEIYKYIDQNGQPRWTDDLSQVPKAQRASAQHFEGVKKQPPDAKGQPSASPAGKAQNQAVDKAHQAVAPSRDALEKEKADLDSQYQQLLQERKALEQLKAKAQSPADRSALKKRISAYNDKTDHYENQLNAFNKKIQTYNQKIMGKQPSAKGNGSPNPPKEGKTP
jgi:vacuolar-type H+-ATPase subunit I/STV1